MVYNFTRKSKQCSWSEESLRIGMEKVKTGGMSLRAASNAYGIPYTTLQNHVKSGSIVKQLGRFRPVFSEEMEGQLVHYITEMDSLFYGMTISDLGRLAYQLAEQNKISHSFKNETAGFDWIKGFRKRHPQLALRSPEPTSLARARGFNRVQVERFFHLLNEIKTKHMIEPSDMYNMDETGIKTSASRPPKVISLRGKRQVGVITSAEKGKLITAICCCSATGNFIAPALIFPRKKVPDRLLDGSPPGTHGFCSDSGWINSEIFVKWLRLFSERTRPSQDQKVLLILDNHESHVCIEALDFATEVGIVMLSVPPHTTHKLQPLDRGVYGPFKAHFERTVDTWQKNHPGRVIGQYDMAMLFGDAYTKACSLQNAVKGFAACGIHPYNPDVFQDIDFAPASVTDRPPQYNNDGTEPTQTPNPTEDRGGSFIDIEIPTPGCSGFQTQQEATPTPSPAQSFELFRSPVDIRPLPHAAARTLNKRQRAGKRAEMLTSSPVKTATREKSTKKTTTANKITPKKRGRKQVKHLGVGKKSKTTAVESPDCTCLVCDELYTEPLTEDWIQCEKCNKWAHEKCTSYEGGIFMCDSCS